jgi:hypothetical protein
MKRLLPGFLILAAVYGIFFTAPGCANMIPPTGGPRDSLPPVLMNATPRDSSLNFNSKKITFTFNEYVQLTDVQQNLIVSPVPKTNPTVEFKLRNVTVTLRDTLEENTTYTLNFGNSIRDNNEGNPLKNFSYAFSTGPELDSFSLQGNVTIAETGKVDSTLIVILHQNLADSAVSKERPRYIARLDGSGNFMFQNLPSGTFNLYALKDEGGMRRYSSPGQLFAYADAPVVIPFSGEEIKLRAFIDSVIVDDDLPAPSGANAAQPKTLQYNTNLINNSVQDLLSPLELTVRNVPFKTFDSNGVKLYNELYQLEPSYSAKLDTSNFKVIITNRWKENTTYNLILDKAFATDTLNRSLAKTDTLTFQTKRENEYGAVRLRFLNLDLSLNPILQFVQSDKVIKSYPMSGREFATKLFEPGEYSLRIVLDENKNGIWDTGKFLREKRQPERIIFIERKVNVKANWDNEIDITL